MLVAALVREQRPSDTCVLRRQCHRSDVLVAPDKQSLEPAISLIRLPLGRVDHRARPVDQERAQVYVAALADPTQRRFAPGAFVPRHHAEPGRYLPSILEALRIAQRGYQCARADRADAGNCFELAALLVVSMPERDLAFHFPDLLVQRFELFTQPFE